MLLKYDLSYFTFSSGTRVLSSGDPITVLSNDVSMQVEKGRFLKYQSESIPSLKVTIGDVVIFEYESNKLKTLVRFADGRYIFLEVMELIKR